MHDGAAEAGEEDWEAGCTSEASSVGEWLAAEAVEVEMPDSSALGFGNPGFLVFPQAIVVRGWSGWRALFEPRHLPVDVRVATNVMGTAAKSSIPFLLWRISSLPKVSPSSKLQCVVGCSGGEELETGWFPFPFPFMSVTGRQGPATRSSLLHR